MVAFHSKAMRRLSYHPVVDVSGGFYVTPTLQGARNGAQIAQAWATVMHMGEEGYVKAAARLHAATEALKTAVQNLPGLRLLLDPDAAIVPIISDDPHVDVHAGIR